MPKMFITILVAVMIAVGFVTVLVLKTKIEINNIKIFNQEYEEYNKDNLTGADIASVINKVKNHNTNSEDHQIAITIRITEVIEGEKYDITVDIDQIYQQGTEKFVQFYGWYKFKCTETTYDGPAGKINGMKFENIQNEI